MTPDDEWSRWTEDYRSVEGPTPEAAAIIATARGGHWRRVADITVQVASHVFGIVAFAVLSVTVKHLWPFASLVIPAFGASLAFTVWVRFGTWRAAADTVVAFVDVAWRRRRAEVIMLRASEILLGVLALGFAIWLPYFLASGQGRPDLGMPFLVARLVFAVVTFLGTWLYLRFKLRRAVAKLEEVARVRDSLRGNV